MEYDINMIRALCERYFDGESSSEDEKILRDYFRENEDVPSDLRAVKVMICGFSEAASMTYRPDVPQRKSGIRKIVWGIMTAAAAAAICIGIFRRETYGYDSEGNAITDPQVALQGTSYLAYLDNLETSFDIARILTQEMENNN